MPQLFSLNNKEKDFCVALARKSIQHFLENNFSLELGEAEIKKLPKKLLEKKACFVTLKINERLRGCIGHLSASQSLFLDIIENAYNAAFEDSRFPILNKNEFEKVTVEVSVLTDPEDLLFSDEKNLLEKIRPEIDGLILRKGRCSATFLPSVWEELTDKEQFLSQLCAKAGMSPNEWRLPGLKVQRYEAIKAQEK